MSTIVSSAVREVQATNAIRLRSFSGDQWYSISLNDRTCTCAGFVATSAPCKHLNAVGVYGVPRQFVAAVRPTFSQALSGMVKSIRLRRAEDAVYWLMYLDTFKKPQSRFRTARRILIGSAEDGHSISVMERVVTSFSRISKTSTGLSELISEIVRICAVPNWWCPSTNGQDYIYHGMLGERMLWQMKDDPTPESFTTLIGQSIVEQDKAKALAAVMGLNQCGMGATKQAEFILDCAKKADHKQAARLARVHLSARGALSSDNNFTCQAAWVLAGGTSPVSDVAYPVGFGEVIELREKAQEKWKHPEPIPGWCCDPNGVGSVELIRRPHAGDDAHDHDRAVAR